MICISFAYLLDCMYYRKDVKMCARVCTTNKRRMNNVGVELPKLLAQEATNSVYRAARTIQSSGIDRVNVN